jgi:hypothetical protein
MLTLRQVAGLLGYKQTRPVVNLIRAGKLKAINLSTTSGYSVWRVRPEDLDALLLDRTYRPDSPPARKAQRRKPAESTPQYV